MSSHGRWRRNGACLTLFAEDTRRTQAIGRGAANALRVLAALRQRPVLSLKQLCLTSRMTFPTAGKAMHHLVASDPKTGLIRPAGSLSVSPPSRTLSSVG